MQLSRASPPALAVALSGRSEIVSPSSPRRQLMQARRSTYRQGRTAVLVSASATLTSTEVDLGTQPLVINHLNISTYTQTNRFGKQLWEMKKLIKESGNFRSENEKRVCLALAMQEDTLMAAHDFLKDGKGGATNLSIYNLSKDLIECSGYPGDLDQEASKWNGTLDHVKDATNIILDYLRGDAPRKNIPRTSVKLPPAASCINFIRGGRSGYQGTTPSNFSDRPEVWEKEMLSYRQAVATMVDLMAKDNTLMGDNRRIEIVVDWV